MTTVLDTTTIPGVRTLYRLALLLAFISGVFFVVFCIILAVNYHGLLSPHFADSAEVSHPGDPSYRKPAGDSFNRLPTDYHSILALREELAKNRQDETLKTQIRELDHQLRVDYFQRRLTMHRIIPFLFAASILFFASIRTANVLNRQIPNPDDASQQSEKKSPVGFAVVTAWLMLLGGLYIGLLLSPPPQMELMFLEKLTHLAGTPGLESADGGRQTAAGREPATMSPSGKNLTEEILAKHWISFRNFDGNGIGFSEKPPIKWDGKTGENIIWKSEVPLSGNSSPVIWTDDAGGKLFLTGADEHTQKIFCYDIKNGDLLWTADVTRQGLAEFEVDADTSYAAPTPVVDGRHVYALFANGELVAVDFTGKPVWRYSFGIPESHYGFASSPALCFDRLIVQFDVGDGDEENDAEEDEHGYKRKSKLIAFNLDNGDVLWETPRSEIPGSWSSPTIKKIGDSYQIITCANPFVIAYNPEDGKEIWRCKCLNGDVGPSAAALGNAVMITNESPRTTVIDATGSGDVTATHILWVGRGSTPDTASPVIADEYFVMLSYGGFLTGYDPKVLNPNNKQARFWELEVGDMANFYASPLRVGTLLYLFDKTEDNAKAFVIDLSKVAVTEDGTLTEESAAAMIVSENPMPEPCVTSPAVLNNRLYIRSASALYCIGEK